MIKGMTGFGSAHLSKNGVKADIEIKSVNHRYLDISFYLPMGFASIEEKIRQLIQKHMERGRVVLSIKLTHKPQQAVSVNQEVVKQYIRHSHHLQKQYKLKGEISLPELIKMPGVVEVKESIVYPEDIWVNLEQSLKRALSGLVEMRRREGRSLSTDVADKLRRMTQQITKIKTKANAILREKKKLLTGEEFQTYQKGNDVSEEISRILHYIAEIRMLLKNIGAVGKKIDFVAQEMQRETNTIGAKLQDKDVANAVITLKSKIEKIREQAQNIE